MKTAAGPTLPGPCTEASATRTRLLAIRWIFPSNDGQPTLLGASPLTLGRSSESDVVLEGDQVSRSHATIRREGMVFLIRDLDSRNGLFVNGSRVGESVLSIGNLLRIGEWLGRVVEVDAKATESQQGFQQVVPGYWAGPVLWPLLSPLRNAAVAKVPILIEGETGTGKEGIAQAIHAWSGRPGKIVAVNCAAIPENLAEGELFGYRKGAFTGAERAHDGYLRAADKGTLFLDEVADLPASLQPKLLRALEQGQITPIGQSSPVAVDVRLVAAVQRPLSEAVEEKRFRPDLYARLDGLCVRLPPLRERVDEIPFLFQRLLEQHSAGKAKPEIETPLVEALCQYGWPYNIRELDRLVQQLVALHGRKKSLSRADLPEKLRADLVAPKTEDTSVPKPSTDTILDVLAQEGGNVRRAADRLMLSRQQLYRMLESIPHFDIHTFRKDLEFRRMTDRSSDA